MKSMLDQALAAKVKLDKQLQVLQEKMYPIQVELNKINGVINLLQPGNEDDVDVVAPSTATSTKPPYSVSDLIRTFIKGRDSINTAKMYELCELAYPSFLPEFKERIHVALIYLSNCGEIEKFGQGHQSIYKPTDKLKAPVLLKPI